MTTPLNNSLAPIRSRMKLSASVRLAGLGAVAGGACLILVELLRLSFGIEFHAGVLAAVFAAFPAVGGIIGQWRECTWPAVAQLVDNHYNLKDRTLTALEFSDVQKATAFQELQIQDAKQHLADVDPRAVVPISAPARWQCVPLLLFCGLRFLITPTIGSEPQPLMVTEKQSDAVIADIQEEIDELETLAEESATEELKELVGRLKMDLRELKVPTLTVRDSMKTVSEMQKKMRDMVKEMDVAAMDAQLRNVGEAIAGAKAFKPTADAIGEDNLNKAATVLEELTEEELSAEEMKAAESLPTAEKLAEAAEAARAEGLEELSEQLSDLSEGVKSGKGKAAQEKAKDLAQTIKRQNVRRQLSNVLKNKSDQLGQSKKQLAVQSQSEGDGSMAGRGQNLKKGKTDKSQNDIASQKAGAKSAGNIHGPKTQLQSQRQMAELTGELGDEGDSETETETTAAPDSTQKAQRRAQEVFNRYQKMSDAVLDAEAIPPGHRETIRRYFELIRPPAASNKIR